MTFKKISFEKTKSFKKAADFIFVEKSLKMHHNKVISKPI
jgi:hypothetical protein